LGKNNAWDNGVEGNYWSNYNGTDNNSDGIGDTPYLVDSNAKDNYPFMRPIDTLAIPLPTLPIALSITIPPVEPSQSPAQNPSPSPSQNPSPTPTPSSVPEPSPNLSLTEPPNQNSSPPSALPQSDDETEMGAGSETESFPIILVLASVASATVVSAGLLVHFKKRNRQVAVIDQNE
jgi:hypothetical protein